MWGRSIVDSGLQTQLNLDRRTCSKLKSGSSELPQDSLEDRGSIKLSILVGEWMSWPFIFCMLEDHTLLIVHVCIWNGNGMASMNSAMLSERGRVKWKHHHFFYSYCISRSPPSSSSPSPSYLFPYRCTYLSEFAGLLVTGLNKHTLWKLR